MATFISFLYLFIHPHYKYKSILNFFFIHRYPEKEKPSKMAMRSKLPLLFLLFSVFLLSALAASKQQDPELFQCQHQCRTQRQFDEKQTQQCEQQCEEYHRQKQQGQGGQEGEGEQQQQQQQEDNPYVFQAHHFTTKVQTPEGRVEVLQNFAQRSKLLRGLRNYRVEFLQANPRAFTVLKHIDAQTVLFVSQGRAIVTLLLENNRESFNLRLGDIIRIPAGTPFYIINKDENQKLSIAQIIQPVSTPGRFEDFFGPGGQNPQSFFSAFSNNILEAIFQTKSDEIQKVFGQDQGAIIKASREQIKSLTPKEEGGIWPFGSHDQSSRGPFNVIDKRPSQANKYGRLHEVDSDDYKQLQDLNLAVSVANITKGSLQAPFFSSEATTIVVVFDGEGYFEMACPHFSSSQSKSESGGQKQGEGGGGSESSRGQGQEQSGPSYHRVSARLRPGVVVVVPAGHPVVTVASNDKNLLIVSFEINAENNVKYQLAGGRNVLNQLKKEAKELVFNVPARVVEELFGKNKNEGFFPGPRQQQEEGRAYA